MCATQKIKTPLSVMTFKGVCNGFCRQDVGLWHHEMWSNIFTSLVLSSVCHLDINWGQFTWLLKTFLFGSCLITAHCVTGVYLFFIYLCYLHLEILLSYLSVCRSGNVLVSVNVVTLPQVQLVRGWAWVTALGRVNHLGAEPGIRLSHPFVDRRDEYLAKAGRVNRHIAWCTSSYVWFCSVGWFLAES